IEKEEQAELAKLERLKKLAEAAGEYLESTDRPMQSDKYEFTYIPADPDRPGLNPETSAALDNLIERAAQEIAERNQCARESAKVWADAFAQGGEEAAEKALKEHLQKYQTPPSDEE